MSFFKNFRNGLLGLNHVVFSEKNRELNSVISFLRKSRIRLLGSNHLSFQRKLRTEQRNVTFENI